MLPNLYKDVCPAGHGMPYVFAHSQTAARYVVPEDWKEAMVTIVSVGSTLTIAFGDEGVMVGDGEVATALADGTIAPNMASGFKVPAGAMVSWPVSPDQTHFAVDSDGTDGYWLIVRSSGKPQSGDVLPAILGKPLLHLDASRRDTLDLNSGAITVARWACKVHRYPFEESSAPPDLLDAAAAGAGVLRPAVSFVAGSSEKLVCANAELAAALGGEEPFTLAIVFRRGATGAAHTLFSVGTSGSDNGRWDVSIDASDDVVITRVDDQGNSSTSTYATTVSAGLHLLVITFDGSAPKLWFDRAAQSLSGTAAGDVGTPTKVTVGARGYNTSTFGQYLTGEIPEVLAFPYAASDEQVAALHDWLKRRHGK